MQAEPLLSPSLSSCVPTPAAHRARSHGAAAGALPPSGLAALEPGGRPAAWRVLPRLGRRAGQLPRGLPVSGGLRHAGCHYLLRLLRAALLLRRGGRQAGAGRLHQRPRRAGAPRHHRAACLRSLPDCWLHLHCLHHPGLFSGNLLLHLLETQGAVTAANPLLAPQLSDGDPAHDLDLYKPQSTFQAVQHSDQLQLHRGLHPKVLLCQGRARLPGALPTPTVYHRPPYPPDPAIGLPGVTPILCLPAPAGAPTAREDLSRLQFQLTGHGHKAVTRYRGRQVDAAAIAASVSEETSPELSSGMERVLRKYDAF